MTSPTTAADPRWSGPVVATLVLVIGINPATLHLFIPAMPAIQTAFAIETATVQWALSLALAATAPATLLWGPVSDAVGRRRTLMIASLLIAAGSLAAATASSFGALLIGRVVQACGAAAGPVLAASIVFDIHGDRRAGPALARILVGMIVATMTAPFVGGLLTDTVGWRSTFLVTLTLATLLFVLTWRVLPETHRPADRTSLRPAPLWSAWGRLLRHPVYLGHALMVACSMAIMYAFMAAAPHVMVHLMGRSASEFGIRLIGVGLGFLAGNLVAVRWTTRVGSTPMILIGSTLSLAACGGLTIALMGGALTPWTIFGPAIVAAFACGLSMPNAEAVALSASPEASGTASSLTSGLVLLIAALTSQAVGWTLNESPRPLGIAMTIAAALALAAFVGGTIASAQQTQPDQQRERGNADQDTVEAIHQAAMPGQEAAEVLHVRRPLEGRRQQVADDARHAHPEGRDSRHRE